MRLVQHHAEDDLVDGYWMAKTASSAPTTQPAAAPAIRPSHSDAGGAGHHGGDERAEQQLALDADVHHAGPRADHAGERAEHDRDGLAERALQQVHHVERGGLAGVRPAQQGQHEQEHHDRPMLTRRHRVLSVTTARERRQHQRQRAARVAGLGGGQRAGSGS